MKAVWQQEKTLSNYLDQQNIVIDYDTSISTLVEHTSFIYINYFDNIMYQFQRNTFSNEI